MTPTASVGGLPIGLTVRGPRRWRRRFDEVFGDLTGPAAMTVRLHRRGPGRLAVTVTGQRVSGTPPECATAVRIEHSHHVAAHAAATFAVLTGAAVAFGPAGLALVAPPRAGATTLARALFAVGAAHVSDVVVLIDSTTNSLQPFPLPLLSDGALPIRASTLAPLAPATPLRALVVPQRSEVAGAPSLTPISPAAALALLATSTAAATAHETEFFRRLTAITRATPTYLAQYHEAADVVPLLRAEFA